GRYSILYHRYAPTRVVDVAEGPSMAPCPSGGSGPHRHHLLRTAGAVQADEAERTWLLFNADVWLGLSVFGAEPGRFWRNGGSDEIHFVHSGGGVLESVFGGLDYRP